MKRSDPGYTLIELLFAMGIASVLILSCAALMRLTGEDHTRVTADVGKERDARRILDQLHLDLMAAHQRGWHAEPDVGDVHAAWFLLRPLASQSAADAVGDLCAVSYALRQQDGGQGAGHYHLIRTQHDSAVVQRAIESGQESALWELGGNGDPLSEEVIEFELWPVMQRGADDWQPWHPELRAMPEAVEVRLVLAGEPERVFNDLIHLGIDAE